MEGQDVGGEVDIVDGEVVVGVVVGVVGVVVVDVGGEGDIVAGEAVVVVVVVVVVACRRKVGQVVGGVGNWGKDETQRVPSTSPFFFLFCFFFLCLCFFLLFCFFVLFFESHWVATPKNQKDIIGEGMPLRHKKKPSKISK